MSTDTGWSLAEEEWLIARREQEDALASEHMPLGDLMSATAASYHARGENCPWDCAGCPGNIAADEADAEAAWEALTDAERQEIADRAARYEAAEQARLAELAPPF